MTRVLITGGSGFIGTNLVAHYLARGDTVLNLDIEKPRQPGHESVWRQIDLLNAEALTNAIADFDPQIALHMAARTDLEGSSLDDYAVNTVGVSNVVSALNTLNNLQLALFASSMLVCRIGYRPQAEDDYAPSTSYGESKIEGELRVRREADPMLPWIIVRPTSIWGPWFRKPYRDFFTAVRRGRYVHPRRHRIRRNYGFVLNSVYQIERLADQRGAGLLRRTVYMADYEPIELKTWACQIQREFGARPVREVPVVALKIAARFGDLLTVSGIKGFPINSFRLHNLMTDCLLDTAPLQRAVGPLPFDTPSAVAVTCRWMKSHADC